MSQDHELVIERSLSASPQKVYEAWTNPEVLVKWWGPVGMSIPVCEMDVVEGGNWKTTMANDEGGEYTVTGQYKTLSPHDHIAFTWAWSQEDGSRGHETIVNVVLEETSGGTKMTMTQKEFRDVEQRDNHNSGWTSSFTKLENILS